MQCICLYPSRIRKVFRNRIFILWKNDLQRNIFRFENRTTLSIESQLFPWEIISFKDSNFSLQFYKRLRYGLMRRNRSGGGKQLIETAMLRTFAAMEKHPGRCQLKAKRISSIRVNNKWYLRKISVIQIISFHFVDKYLNSINMYRYIFY